jgi:hypothetical protein
MGAPIVNGLCTLDEVKKSIFNGTAAAASADEDDLSDYISAATPVIEDITGPMFVRDETRTRNGGKPAIAMPFPFTAVVSLTENGAPVTDFSPNPAAGLIYAGTASTPRTFQRGNANIQATVTVGSDPIPPNVVLATRELVRFWWQQGRQGNRPAFGDQSTDTVQTPSGFAVPRRVLELCRPNRQAGGFA